MRDCWRRANGDARCFTVLRIGSVKFLPSSLRCLQCHKRGEWWSPAGVRVCNRSQPVDIPPDLQGSVGGLRMGAGASPSVPSSQVDQNAEVCLPPFCQWERVAHADVAVGAARAVASFRGAAGRRPGLQPVAGAPPRLPVLTWPSGEKQVDVITDGVSIWTAAGLAKLLIHQRMCWSAGTGTSARPLPDGYGRLRLAPPPAASMSCCKLRSTCWNH